MSMNIEKKVERVLIVGGNSGMGFALAERLLRDGSEVTIVGRSRDKLAVARARLSDAQQLHTIAADITQEDHVARLFERCGPLEHIVTTAADIEGLIDEVKATVFDKTGIQLHAEVKIVGEKAA